MTRPSPGDLEELREAVGEALAAEEPLEIVGGGSKRGLGRPMQTPRMLDLSRLSGIRDYQPSELVLTAAAATPVDEIERALGENGQMLAFEPPDWRALLGTPEARPTLGGVIACNLSGPRRVKAGAARDHFLGFRAVSGRAEVFKAGGKVVKNVTGYDLPKLLAGSYGTLAVLEEVTLKVLPRPEHTATLVLGGLDAAGRRRGNAPRARFAARGLGCRVSACRLGPAVGNAWPGRSSPRRPGPLGRVPARAAARRACGRGRGSDARRRSLRRLLACSPRPRTLCRPRRPRGMARLGGTGARGRVWRGVGAVARSALVSRLGRRAGMARRRRSRGWRGRGDPPARSAAKTGAKPGMPR